MTPKTIGIAAGLLASASAALGSTTIMQTQTFGPTTPAFTDSVNFNKFNGNLADLLSVKIKMELTVSGGNAIVDNDGEFNTTVEVTFGTTGSISSSDVTLLDGLFDPVVASVGVLSVQNVNLDGNDADPTGQFDNDGGGDNATVNGPAGTEMNMGFINSVFFSDYVGAGTFAIDIDVDTDFQVSGGSGVAGSFTPQIAEGSIMVIYEVIPAPSSAALLGLGGLAMARRRR